MLKKDSVIIIKKKKVNHGGHHGGSWKIAYADFVTAMMAFFLLMWLINVVSEEQRKGIADYFAPNFVSMEARLGGGGLLGGVNMSSNNNSDGRSNEPQNTQRSIALEESGGDKNDYKKNEFTIEFKEILSIPDKIQKTDGEHFSQNTESDKKAGEKGKTDQDHQQQKNATPVLPDDHGNTQNTDQPEDLQDFLQGRNAKLGVGTDNLTEAEKSEQEKLLKAAYDLRNVIRETTAIKEMVDNVIMELRPEGLLIQVVDGDERSMFPSGSSKPLPQARNLFEAIARIIDKLGNNLVITGHTEVTTQSETKEYGNWELSADRANAARRILEECGISSKRIEAVVGKEARELLTRINPSQAVNRRITILLRRGQLEGALKARQEVQGALKKTAVS